MGVLVLFDAQGAWGQTHVCDGLLQQSLQPLGVRWGRSDPGEGAGPAGPWQAAPGLHAPGPQVPGPHVPGLHVPYVPPSARWTHWDLARLGTAGRALVPQGRAVAQVLRVQQGTLLVYLAAGQGHVGLLCEAGEWLALPAGLAFTLDASAAPDIALLVALVVLGGDGGPGTAPLAVAARGAPPLPSHADFIERMLELTGYADAE